MTTEVYSIDDVITSDPRTNVIRNFSPFYSLRHAYGEQMEKVFSSYRTDGGHATASQMTALPWSLASAFMGTETVTATRTP